MNSIYQETINKLKNELDYHPLLEEACKLLVLKHNPCPSQCNLEYYYFNGTNKLKKVYIKIDDIIHAIVFCGNIVMNDDPNVLVHTKPYIIYLGD